MCWKGEQFLTLGSAAGTEASGWEGGGGSRTCSLRFCSPGTTQPAARRRCQGLSSAGAGTTPERKHIFTISLKCSEEPRFSEITHFCSIRLYLSMQNSEVDFSFFLSFDHF